MCISTGTSSQLPSFCVRTWLTPGPYRNDVGGREVVDEARGVYEIHARQGLQLGGALLPRACVQDIGLCMTGRRLTALLSAGKAVPEQLVCTAIWAMLC